MSDLTKALSEMFSHAQDLRKAHAPNVLTWETDADWFAKAEGQERAGHKYIKREKGKNGKWVYTYNLKPNLDGTPEDLPDRIKELKGLIQDVKDGKLEPPRQGMERAYVELANMESQLEAQGKVPKGTKRRPKPEVEGVKKEPEAPTEEPKASPPPMKSADEGERAAFVQGEHLEPEQVKARDEWEQSQPKDAEHKASWLESAPVGARVVGKDGTTYVKAEGGTWEALAPDLRSLGRTTLRALLDMILDLVAFSSQAKINRALAKFEKEDKAQAELEGLKKAMDEEEDEEEDEEDDPEEEDEEEEEEPLDKALKPTSLFAAVLIPEPLRSQFPEYEPGGPPGKQVGPHVTVYYRDCESASEAQNLARVLKVAVENPNQDRRCVTLAGLGHFDNDQTVAWTPALGGFVDNMHYNMARDVSVFLGIHEYKPTERPYFPHATIQYLPKGERWMGHLPQGSFDVSTVLIQVGGETVYEVPVP